MRRDREGQGRRLLFLVIVGSVCLKPAVGRTICCVRLKCGCVCFLLQRDDALLERLSQRDDDNKRLRQSHDMEIQALSAKYTAELQLRSIHLDVT